jgi:hypothetical protein
MRRRTLSEHLEEDYDPFYDDPDVVDAYTERLTEEELEEYRSGKTFREIREDKEKR